MSATNERKDARTTWIPVTTMEEMPLLDEAELAELLHSLKEAEADIAAGNGVEHLSETFVQEFLELGAALAHPKSK